MSDLSQTLGIAISRWPIGRVIVRLDGALDAVGAHELIDAATGIDPGPGDRVVLQLQDVTFLDSAGIGALCYTETFVRARGGQFVIAAPGARAFAMLESAGLGRFCVHDDEARRPQSTGGHPGQAPHPAGSR